MLCDKMSLNPIYGTPVLASVEFFAFRDELLEKMAEHQAEQKVKAKKRTGYFDMAPVMECLDKIYTKLGGGTFHACGDSKVGSFAGKSFHETNDPAVSDTSEDESPAPQYFGADCPMDTVPNNSGSPKATGPIGCDLRDPSTWPTDTTPVWASSKQIIHGVSSPTELVNERFQS